MFQENIHHPEFETYLLVHESEFQPLQDIYGSVDVPFFNVRFVPTTTTASADVAQDSKSPIEVQYDFDGSIIPCPECVRACRFATGGIGDFENVALRLKVEVSYSEFLFALLF